MASSSPTTSIPIQEPVFLQFLHDVHHAYLLLHRAMALLPPTLIPNIEPTPLPSTDVWNQPDGLRPHYSERTNAFIDAVHVPSPDLAEEEALMDEWWNLIFQNRINMLLLLHLTPSQIHRSSQPPPRRLPNANRIPERLPRHLQNVVAVPKNRDPVPRAHCRPGLLKTNKNFVL